MSHKQAKRIRQAMRGLYGLNPAHRKLVPVGEGPAYHHATHFTGRLTQNGTLEPQLVPIINPHVNAKGYGRTAYRNAKRYGGFNAV